ncbi:TetR/AcrR family transcriptional regulator [Bradyrhizobium prioriisuperbiae]|uniref:TetR/AcrR family transcriptional regulator n=1 Tax=Bradyrhizobium prioriisuperbiae TaxID=2854389 RepID=UPI0028E34253|nr:TetR/AcrR family transcriptional regulator [Bradyrhizobium prioritasuperba]
MAMGRPREFDLDAAVAAALPIFLEKGYEGAAFGELIAAMGIKPPSFYAAFGNKEGLFRHVLALYAERGAPVVAEALSQPTAYGVIERLLRLTADADTDPSRPAGCLFVQGALSCSNKATKIRDELTARRTAIEPILRERIEQARTEGDASIEGVPQKVARYISTVVQGMAVQAAGGSTREELHEIVDVVLSGMSRSR